MPPPPPVHQSDRRAPSGRKSIAAPGRVPGLAQELGMDTGVGLLQGMCECIPVLYTAYIVHYALYSIHYECILYILSMDVHWRGPPSE